MVESSKPHFSETKTTLTYRCNSAQLVWSEALQRHEYMSTTNAYNAPYLWSDWATRMSLLFATNLSNICIFCITFSLFVKSWWNSYYQPQSLNFICVLHVRTWWTLSFRQTNFAWEKSTGTYVLLPFVGRNHFHKSTLVYVEPR